MMFSSTAPSGQTLQPLLLAACTETQHAPLGERLWNPAPNMASKPPPACCMSHLYMNV